MGYEVEIVAGKQLQRFPAFCYALFYAVSLQEKQSASILTFPH